MKIIPIKLPNKKASVPCYVDDEDYEMLSRYKWNLHSRGYATTAFPNFNMNKNPLKRQGYTTMHNVILWTPKGRGVVADHIDRNKLNNRRNNLRICTLQENSLNKKLPTSNISGYRGIHWVESVKKWRGQITVKGNKISLGYFRDKREAAASYDEAARKYFKKFAQPNLSNE